MIRKVCTQYVSVISTVNEKCGLTAWLLLPICAFIVIEVVARYLFNSPTIWVWDANRQLMAVQAALTGGYIMYHDGHVRSDLLYAKWSWKKKAYVDIGFSFLGFLFVGFTLYAIIEAAVVSVERNEHVISALSPPLYPLKIVMAVGTLLFLLQILAELLRNILRVTGGVDEAATAGDLGTSVVEEATS